MLIQERLDSSRISTFALWQKCSIDSVSGNISEWLKNRKPLHIVKQRRETEMDHEEKNNDMAVDSDIVSEYHLSDRGFCSGTAGTGDQCAERCADGTIHGDGSV